MFRQVSFLSLTLFLFSFFTQYLVTASELLMGENGRIIRASDVDETDIQYDAATCRTSSLYPSTWPNDHGDSARTKFTVGAGLPAEFDASDLKVTKQPNPIPKAMWLYTYGEQSEYVVYMGGTLVSAYVAKADAKTLEVLQRIDFPMNMYMGGLLMHRDGHIYAVHGNVLYRFWFGDLYNSTSMALPSRLNGRMVQTNGMVVTSDGLLVMRQWSYYLEDMLLLLVGMPDVIPRVLTGIVLVAATAAGFAFLPRRAHDRQSKGSGTNGGKSIVRFLLGSFVGAVSAVLLLLAALIVLLQIKIGPFDPVLFLTSSILVDNKGGGSEVKLIDPATFTIKHDLLISERCSGGRTALWHLSERGEDAIVVIGDEFIHQLRWSPQQDRLYEVEEWRERYRSRREGTYPGTGPAIHDGVVFFTDNTFPVSLRGHSYSMFRKPLSVDSGAGGAPQAMTRVHLTEAGTAGFMFWSIVVSPRYSDMLVWDTAGHSVQMRRAEDLSLRWNISSIQGDCASIAADRDHVYFTDYSEGSKGPSAFVKSVVGSKKLFPRLKKYFIVADARTGAVKANITLQEQGLYSSSIIAPGAHNDVYIGAADGLLRVHT